MLVFDKIRKALLRHLSTMRWYVVVLMILFYGLSSFWLLQLAGEDALLERKGFIYWLIVTASTVGYGDMSPETALGRNIVALYIIPVGLSIFAYVVGRAAAWFSDQWRTRTKGLKKVHTENHILLIGWNGERTLHLLSLLKREQKALSDKQTIVLCVKVDIENPLPGKIEFVKVTSFNKSEDMDKACIDTASVILIDNPQDDLTMTTALYAAKRNPTAHIVAYFDDESLVKLLTQHCPNVECMPSVAVEMLAKSAFDPGSSALHHDLLSVEDGKAQYSISVPNDAPTLSGQQVFVKLKAVYNATFIGLAKYGNLKHIELNPPFSATVEPGDKLYYIADERITEVDWQAIHVQ